MHKKTAIIGYDSVQSFSISKSGLTRHQQQHATEPLSPRRDACYVRAVLSSAELQTISSAGRESITRNVLQDVGKQHKLSGNTWVEVEVPVENNFTHEEKIHNWERARHLNDYIEKEQQRKSERLQLFQKEVRRRVKQKEEEKRSEMMSKAYRAVELERKIHRKTAFLAQACLPHASDVIVQGRSNLIIKTDEHPDAIEPTNYSENNLRQVEETRQTVESERKVKSCARQKLLSRKVMAQHSTMLPGGTWKSTSPVENELPESNGEINDILLNYNEEELPEESKVLHTTLSNVRLSEDDGISGCKSCKNARAVSMITGQDDEEIRKQEVRQRALLRRLFMDIEREQVKEYSKQRQHQNKIAEIKQWKEEERLRQERSAERQCFPSPRHIASSEVEKQRRHQEEMETLKKEKEAKRYVKALRSVLKEKIERHGVDVPALCSCGDTIWDTHPDTCANNCPFYRNTRAYERAIQALMTSCETAWTE